MENFAVASVLGFGFCRACRALWGGLGAWDYKGYYKGSIRVLYGYYKGSIRVL